MCILYYSKDLDELYKDEDNKMSQEVASMKGSQMFTNFYDKLKSSQEFYSRYPDAVSEEVTSVEATVEVNFSGEEVFGKYLDLTEFHLKYCNIPNIVTKDLDYLQYLEKFNIFFYLSENVKKSKPYAAYVKDLSVYLTAFFHRVQPLMDLSESVQEWLQKFDAEWKEGKVEGWSFHRNIGGGKEPQSLRLGMYNSVDELMALGLNRLKDALLAMNLKCGGTLQERADRLWSVRGKKWDDIPKKLKSSQLNPENTPKGSSGEGSSSATSTVDPLKETAWLEFYISSITELMVDIVIATRKHSEKQQTRSVEEKEKELLEEEFGMLPDVGEDAEAHEADDDDAPIYNPLNLPLGWDGKPIPYWLYKLHGLGVEYKCEICGDQSYWGRRAFDKHFQEWRHAHGMRCLGIPNTKHFHDITLIADAISLYSKIKNTIKTDQFVGDNDEEFEDSEGNVLNRRTYEDLARQGLL